MKETNNTKPYTFKVWIDGNYYLDDEEFEKEIPLSEKEVATIKKLIDDYEDDLSQGLMPILKTGSKNSTKSSTMPSSQQSFCTCSMMNTWKS